MMFWLKMAKVPWRGGGHVVVGADGEGEEAAVVGKQLDLHLYIKGAEIKVTRTVPQSQDHTVDLFTSISEPGM